ncbi:MAG: glycoside hydrolase family 3 N-terminal domain-containing protein [Clostridia bacterium]|nr:glycoside hydrolase family 3 N-terminal domain-containing protein [Clostridia bacterium]
MNKQDAHARAESLLKQMTVEEKIAQMTQISYAGCTREEALMWAERGAGSFLHVLGDDAREIQQTALHTRLGIPVLFGIDAVHGHCLNRDAAIFPSQLSMACSFNPELPKKIGRATAEEVAEDGLHWTFAPVLCLARDPRWGRVDETFGEDPYLAGEMGAAMIRGFQGDQLDDPESILACAKHYIAYGEAVGARDACDTEVTMRKVREVFLPPFRKAMEADCATVMTAYGSLDGTPLTLHEEVLKRVLRDELGFKGFVVTDWDNVNSLITNQHVCADMEDASVKAAQAGNDMMMRTKEFYEAAVAACKDGRLSMEQVDTAVMHILTVKAELGLLDYPEKPCRKGRIGCEEHRALALDAAREGLVLLRNNGMLPLKGAKKIAVIGPNADDIRAQYGDWTYFTHPMNNPDETEPQRPYTTVLEGMGNVFTDAEIVYHKGCDVMNRTPSDLEGAVAAAKGCDAIVLVLGDTIQQAGETHDRADLSLTGDQDALFRKLRALGIPMTVVLMSSKPLCIPAEAAEADALVVAFNGGMAGGQAIAELLAGKIAPVGRLPISFPVHTGQIPVYYNSLTGWHGGKYEDQPAEPLFAFGEGLGYTTFAYSDLAFDPETLQLTVTVTNTGDVEGTETVQAYLRDVVSSVMTPVKKFVAFTKVTLNAGESKTVSLPLSRESFSLINAKEQQVVEPGEFLLMAGHSSKDADLLTLSVQMA